MNQNNVSPIVQLALTKLDIDKAVRATILPSEYHGEAIVKIAFDLKVGQPGQQRVAASVPWQRIAALALSKLNGVSIESVIREAVSMDTTTAIEEEIAERVKTVVDTLLDATIRPVAGKVTGDVRVLEVIQQ